MILSRFVALSVSLNRKVSLFQGGSYYCYNLVAELDSPGEYYLNRSD
eukprot:COSAG04_NODE_12459_length_651_cov_2.028986_2_plen_46_part_01